MTYESISAHFPILLRIVPKASAPIVLYHDISFLNATHSCKTRIHKYQHNHANLSKQELATPTRPQVTNALASLYIVRALDTNNLLKVILLFFVTDYNYHPTKTRSLNWTIDV